MLFALALLALGCICLTVFQIAKAPVGHEDANGFHMAAPATRQLVASDLARHEDLAAHAVHSIAPFHFPR